MLKKSSCFKRLNEFGKASETLQRISFNELSDSLQYQVRYEHALSLLLQKKYDEAELQYIDINFYTHNESLRNQSLFLGIIIKNELRKWQEADSLFIEYIKFNNINIDSVKISELLKKPKLLNPKTAKIISYFIPGSGQIYSGHVFRGLTSIAFQGSFFTFTFLSIKNGFYFSAATTGFGIFQLIYIGGARYAYYLAEKKNAKKIETYNKKIRDFLFH